MDGQNIVECMKELEALIKNSKGLKPKNRERLLFLAEKVGTYDTLTGCQNRTALEIRLNEEFARAERYGHPLSVVMLDIDYFKKYNDTYGHIQGNEALRYVGKELRRHRRPSDMVVRYGGEEFLMLLPGADLHGAVKVAEDVIERARSKNIETYVGDPKAYGAEYLKDKNFKIITISAGVSSYPAPTQQLSLLIPDADKALYAAKSSGKNIVKEFVP